ncbi:glycosyltransferase family 39 protein [Caldilinea sp.]|uniref:glycosyltransferase family 39 protein n=1 Tax=Caldilinea sp. TaxID=2293560 RepID=UPI002C4B48D5|nr:glycosyltransferase family 39 protein [Caldilinea sp.]
MQLLPLLPLLGATFWLRWQYITRVGLHVDEFSSLWAVRRVLDHGVPLLPSGVLYTRGLLHTYLTALFMQLGGFSFTVGRLPSLLFALAAVVLIYVVGWKSWRLGVGVLAALGLTLLPEAVEAGGRARFYAPMMFWSLLAAWSFFAAIRHTEQPLNRRTILRWHILFAVSFSCAIFSHEEIVLLYPALLLAALLWRGWAYVRLPGAILAQVISLGALSLRLLIEQIGQPGQLLAIQSSQPYLDLQFDGAGLWRLSESLFLEPSRLPWTLGALLAIGYALAALGQRRWRLRDLALPQQATLFYALLFGSVFLLFATLVGASWRNPRYLLFIQSYWLLLGAAGIMGVIMYFLHSRRWQAIAVSAVCVLLVVLMQKDAMSATRERMLGYEHAFAYVATQRAPGDLVMTPQAAGCALVLGAPCDYYTQGRDYEPFILDAGDHLIERWSGATLLSNLTQLEEVLAEEKRVWFVTDGERLLKRFETGFAREVLERFEVVRADDSARVLLFTGKPPLPAPAWIEPFAPIDFTDWMTLERIARSEVTPGEDLIVRTDWVLAEDAKSPTISVQLVSEDGTRPTSADGVLAEGVINPGQAEGTPIPDTKRLRTPDVLEDGLYRLEIVAYRAESADPFGPPIPVDWFWVGPPPAPPALPLSASWRNGIALLGADALPATLDAEAPLTLRLRWQTNAAVAEEHTAFMHLVGPDGALSAQDDHAPRHGFWPTSGWRPGVTVDDAYKMALPSRLESGVYRLLVGWYTSATGERLLLEDGSDALELTQWVVP